ASATVLLSGQAPGDGAVVTLSSDAGAVAAAPASVTVPAGATYAAVPLTTSAVEVPRTVTITASYGGQARSAVLAVTPPALDIVTVDPAAVMGGETAAARVALNGPAPAGGVVLALSISGPA